MATASSNRSRLFISSLILALAILQGSPQPINCPAPCKCSWVLDGLKVDCSRKGLSVYPDFNSLPIEHLDLSYNDFVNFPHQLASISSLSYLDLSNNQISYIDSDALYEFNSLSTLLLANNSIKGWGSINPTEAFNSIKLKRLSLSGNSFDAFNDANPANMLVSESLVQLELESCGITAIGGNILMNGLPSLEHLTLSGNEFSTTTAMPSLSLRLLELSNCNLQRIRQPLLVGLPHLEALNLSWNPALQFSRSNDIIYADMLHNLDVSFCNIDEINLSGMPSLNAISLRGNMLRGIDAQTFAWNLHLERIDLARNSLRVIDIDAFAQLQQLTKLDLSYNEVANWDANIFRANTALVWLNLSRNVIERLTKLLSNSLREINLSWCEIATVDVGAFSGLPKIQRLDLSNNRLSFLPGGMHSATLQHLDLSYCRLTAFRNTTLRDFPELASLHLNGNRFTTPFPTPVFNSSKYLDAIWIGDNPWICDCEDKTFINFYGYLTEKPQKLKDKNNVRCASPPPYYGKTWEMACAHAWLPNGYTNNAEKVWSTILLSIVVLGVLLLVFSCLKKFLRGRKQRSDNQEFRRNQDEMNEIRRQNQRMLEQDGTPNAPDPTSFNCLPSYEDALSMPKPVRPAKSMDDLSASNRSRKKLRRSRTQTENVATAEEEEEEEADDILLDNKYRFRSVEMLSNRDKERTAPMDPLRRTVIVEHTNSGSRRFSTEESRFPASYLKAQNMQSAEKIRNFQSNENSPYTKRKPQIAEIPPFKRATFRSESVEFLTDPEFDAHSKPSSPFARRKPKSSNSPTDSVKDPMLSAPVPVPQLIVANLGLAPPVEDHFAAAQSSRCSSPDEGDFQMLVEAEVTSLAEGNGSSSLSDVAVDLERGKRKKRRNSVNRRASGSFNAAAAAAAAAGDTSSSSDKEAIVMVHKPPMRETLF